MREPETRDAGALSEDIEALRGAVGATDHLPSWRLSAGLLIVIVIAIAATSWLALDRPRPMQARIFSHGVIGVDLGAGDAWLPPAMSSALSAQLVGSGQVRVSLADDMARAPDRTAAVEDVRRRTGANWSVSGELLRGENEVLLLRLSLRDLRSGGSLPAIEVAGSAEALGDLAARASLELMRHLELAPPSPDQIRSASAELPGGVAASRAYVQALEALERNDGQRALDALEVVDRESPGHPMALYARSQAWTLLGYNERAAGDALAAFERRAGLSRERELMLEAHKLETSDEWAEAVEVWRALRRFYPEDIQYGLELADAQMRADRFDDARETLEGLRALPAPLGEDPRIDVTASQVLNRAGRYTEAVEAAEAALTKARGLGALSLVAEAQLAAVASDADGKQERLQEARDIYRGRSHARGESAVLKELADLEVTAGRLDAGIRLYRQAVEVADGAGNPPQRAAAENAMAIALDLQGRLEEGYQLKRRVAAYYRERGVMSRYSIMQENLGISLWKLGRYEEAETAFDEALEIFEEIGDEIGVAWAPYHRGRIAVRRGEVERGRALIDQAIANAADNPEGGLARHSRFERMVAATFAGAFDDAVTAARELSSEYIAVELPLDAAETDIYAARNLFWLNRPTQATETLGRALEQTRESGAGYYAASAQIALVDFTLASGEDSQAACRRLREIQTGMEHAIMRLRGAVRLATCEAWAGDGASVRLVDRLAEIAAEAESLGLFEPAFEARQASAHVLAALGRTSEARSGLIALNERSAAAGWRLAPTDCLAGPPGSRCEVTASAN